MKLPNDTITTFDGTTSIVIASVIINDDDPYNIIQILLVLNPGPMYYSILNVENGTKRLSVVGDYANIVPAVEAYEQNGGDY